MEDEGSREDEATTEEPVHTEGVDTNGQTLWKRNKTHPTRT